MALSTPAPLRVQPRRGLPSVLAPVLPWSGCVLCTHGRGPADARHCGHPQGLGRPVDEMRCNGGACGPEAELQDFPGLRL